MHVKGSVHKIDIHLGESIIVINLFGSCCTNFYDLMYLPTLLHNFKNIFGLYSCKGIVQLENLARLKFGELAL